jgi:hypothetical protein
MNRSPCLAVAVAVAGLCAVPPARADGTTAALDGAASPRLLETHFGPYGHLPARSVGREGRWVRLRLPPHPNGVIQAGLYSYFALAGDFEFSAAYELLALPPPKGGNGVTVGIAADTEGAGGNVSLVRGCLPGHGHGYAVIRGLAAEGGMHFETSFYPTAAKRGRLVLRREKSDVAFLVADGWGESPREICRLPFTDGTVAKVRLYADSGGSPTAADARLGDTVIRAEEITGGTPQREGPRLLWYVVASAGLAAAALSAIAVRRRWRGRRS